MKKVMTIAITAALLVFNTAQAGLFDRDKFFEKECIGLFKTTHNIKAFVKAQDVKKTATNKYDFTPVTIVRGKETKLIRQYCEYYPEEKMVYIGIAKSVVDARRKKEIEDLNRKIIVDRKRAEVEASAAKHAAKLQDIKDKAAAARKVELRLKQDIEDKATAARQFELRIIKDQKIKAEIKKQEQIKKEKEEFKKQYLESAESCVSNDISRVKLAVFPRLHHAVRVMFIENRKITNMKFSGNIMEVSYRFNITTSTKSLEHNIRFPRGSKRGVALTHLNNTIDNVKFGEYGTITATVICKIERV